jgi:hypothetical protein
MRSEEEQREFSPPNVAQRPMLETRTPTCHYDQIILLGASEGRRVDEKADLPIVWSCVGQGSEGALLLASLHSLWIFDR